ncbi:uncharacterized protein CcaverHIS019_0606270 [Cutaneotrichosporon cavernicola]|uniref:CAP-Gly domain-containing protein n=1 Tax=Cutaneotrichosporon cavernicola TaxID=279322 RepID=A0AA48L971_9TREE|nr:uncharacterized protein CcaverHIS019_0606270 [Cutaneotrichosporon cavernicola]BEI94168.1 hypothetical protein CcaverHIS019_0606270 [Cutaneotrichosporon cavernicola]
MSDLPLGTKVRVNAGTGLVRWVGTEPAFAPGKWVGIELDTPTGKNNGSVKGEVYFSCEAGHGVFVRPSQVHVLEMRRAPRTSTLPASSGSSRTSRSTTPARPGQDVPRTAPTPIPATPNRSVSRTSSVDVPPSPAAGPTGTIRAARTRPPAIRTTGTPASRRTSVLPSSASSAAPSPRIPVSPMGRRASAIGTSRTHTPITARGPTQRKADDELMPPPPVPERAPPETPRRIPEPQRGGSVIPSPRRLSHRSQPESPFVAVERPGFDDGDTTFLASPDSSSLAVSPSPHSLTIHGSRRDSLSPGSIQPPSVCPSPSNPSSPLTPKSTAAVFAQKRELEELRIKVRLLESHRTEDQATIKGLEKRAAEGDSLPAIRAKLQAKFQEQAGEIVKLKRENSDMRSENELLESQRQDAFDQAEMATLDREVAEEKAEAAEAETERLNEKIQELELEVAVLKEENAEYDKPIDGLAGGAHTSIAYIQLEKHNERLKDAVIQLRDMLHDSEKEYKLKIHDLEKELSSNSDLSGRFDLTTAKLAHSEAQVEDLKQQLDDALGAEDLLEELTERNLQMGDKMEEMRATIDDLEALKELNDELEESHAESAKQLEAEIDGVTAQLKEEGARSAELEALVVDMEATIGQFRELVHNLQAEIDELREQQASQEHDSAAANKESQALLNLNLKLQSSAVKTQSKTVDLELKKLEAAQLAEHLRIIQAYLPEAYLESEADSVSALLFFLRVGEKVNMLTTVISNLHGLPGALYTVSSEALVGVCELRGKLRSFATLNRRFAVIMRRTQPDDYVALGRVVGELAGVESRVDGWIASVKTDEFNDGECARELDALLAQFNHLAEVMFNHPGLDAGEQQVAAAYTLEDDLDNFAAAVGFVRTEIMALVKDGDVDVELGEYTLDEAVYDPVQRVLNQVRAVKAPAGKLVSVIEEVAASQAALAPEFSDGLRDLVSSVSAAVDMAVRLAQRVRQHVDSLRASKAPLRLTDMDKFLGEVTNTDGEPWDVIASFVQRLASDLADTLPKFRAAKAGQVVSLAAPPPWLARVAAIREAASYNAEAERRVSRLSDELRDMVREIKLRDQSLQEGSVKIETLERRIEGARKQADHILELEREIAKSRKQEKEYEDAIEQLQADQADLESENAKLHRRPTSQGTAPAPEPTTGEQVAGLRAALRFLRSENALLKSRDLYADVHMLPPLRPFPPSPSTPPPLTQEDSDAESDGPATPLGSPWIAHPHLPVTKIALETESKLLLRAVAAYASSPRIVDISGIDGTSWHSRKNSPEAQAWRLARERTRLEGRVKDLAERVRALKQ